MTSLPFDYELPPDLIAQEPVEPRDHSRLLVATRESLQLGHRRFFELPEFLRAGDLLVLNDTRVVHARLLGHRRRTGGKWEGLYLKTHDDGCWEMLCQTGGRPQPGETVIIRKDAASPASLAAGLDGELVLLLEEKLPSGRWRVRPPVNEPAALLLERFGEVPLPPYIRQGKSRSEDADRYQTVYARHAGAVAAPTAGLHFTSRVFKDLASRGIETAMVTLHVGLGTFQPIQVDDYREHKMHPEWGQLDIDAVAALRRCQERGGRVIAVGTTAVRVLETAAREGPLREGPLREWSGETSLYIYPPYRFRVVQGLVTNFHLPRTTLLLMVGAFAGIETLRQAYEAAIRERYRFYSYGDAMVIL